MSEQRSDLFSVSVTVTDPATGEARNLGVWDARTGGELDSEETNYRAAGGLRKALGGPTTPGNVVVSRLYDLTRDHANKGWLFSLVGRGRGAISESLTDAAHVAVGSPTTWSGVLKRVTGPETNSNANDESMIELEFTIEGDPKVA